MSKRKGAFTEDDENFEFKREITTSSKKTITIKDFLQLIENESLKQKKMISPQFYIAGVVFSIHVYPDNSGRGGPGFVGIYLSNDSDEDQITSISVKKASGEEVSWEMQKVLFSNSHGFYEFLSHENYREWANEHGDVLKLEVVVTVHSKAEGGDWTR